jgi:hypothetical protein
MSDERRYSGASMSEDELREELRDSGRSSKPTQACGDRRRATKLS